LPQDRYVPDTVLVDRIGTILYTDLYPNLLEAKVMLTSTVRISAEAKEVLRRLSKQTGMKMQEILGEAIESYRRQLFLQEANAAFARLRADEDGWASEKEERAAWEVTLSDGLRNS
jgi:predicted DNA-binding protein